eukprot:gnl/MRDRNA2_/MRDRNA2_75476_c0_seq1.p1 gnl/MRDRNA2_/MRDRNA2_75476_c0~~gnl/MRDRNA2_/MRDRNA2_75476_c0_seq1.p1  ORF type:complete len:332 (-),score=46.06 gnl/MRDRNA2_/MRDRNA2_75476_c0_seq1:23-1018(-)
MSYQWRGGSRSRDRRDDSRGRRKRSRSRRDSRDRRGRDRRGGYRDSPPRGKRRSRSRDRNGNSQSGSTAPAPAAQTTLSDLVNMPAMQAENPAYEEDPEVEAFIFNNNLNEFGASVLRKKPKVIQQAVMSRGSLANRENPSAACLARIKTAESNFKASGATTANNSSLYNAQLIEQFIVDNKLDDRAAGALREKKEEIQNYVLSRGSLLHERNPSVACLMRIKAAQQAEKEGGGVVLPYNHDGRIDEVRQYIQENGIDERAGAILMEKSKEVQHHVMSRGPLKGAHNPAAVCMLRIKDAEKMLKQSREQEQQQASWQYGVEALVNSGGQHY